MEPKKLDYDYIVVGSGFGGSVSAHRLAEKGYKVLVIEKGKWLSAKDFPKTNWNLKKWLWLPAMRFFGLMKLTFFRHVGVLSGVGVGGGSLVYGNTLPIPPARFFKADSWSHLADWESELKPHYNTALTMLGAALNPHFGTGDHALEKLAEQIGKKGEVKPTNVAVFFGEPGKTVPDPYFKGLGPERAGCIFCGGCFLGCGHNSKNTLDKNYLYLAQKNGAVIWAESEVLDVVPIGNEDGAGGYAITYTGSTAFIKQKKQVTSQGVIFAGGVMGTVKLLLKLKQNSLSRLSNCLGGGVRTNSESLIGVTTLDKNIVLSDGIAIGSILHTDENSFVEPTRYSKGSGFWRVLGAPMVKGSNFFIRTLRMIGDWIRHPITNFKAYFVDDWSMRTQILLFMQTIDSTLKFKKTRYGMKSTIDQGEPPSAFIDEAQNIANKFAGIVKGKPMVLISESIMGIPTTAHILGGANMGRDASEGVIDADNKVFGYKNMMVCDGSMISANPGVNPSLTITALTERAMSKIPAKS